LGEGEDAHLVLLGTEDGGEIVGHVDVIEMNALGLGEDDLWRFLISSSSSAFLESLRERVATLLSATRLLLAFGRLFWQ
jgi:hypothetical protein